MAGKRKLVSRQKGKYKLHHSFMGLRSCRFSKAPETAEVATEKMPTRANLST
jgi:hypothetical protein